MAESKEVTWKSVESKEELLIAWQIRKTVFIQEQRVPVVVEQDPFDDESEHVLVFYQESPVGTGRVRIVDQVAKLERVCILASYRGIGLGKEAVFALENIAKKKGIRIAKLHAQQQTIDFYERLGYQIASDIFYEGGIPHRLMIKKLEETDAATSDRTS